MLNSGQNDGSSLGCHSTLNVPNVQGWCAYPARTVRGALGRKLPCASGTHSTREAGARSPYGPHRGPVAYVSAQAAAAQVEPLERAAPRLVRARAGARAGLGLGLGFGLVEG